MRKFIFLYLLPTSLILAGILKIEQVEKYVEVYAPDANRYIVLFLIFVAVLTYFTTTYSPLKKLEQKRRDRWTTIVEETDKIKQVMPTYGWKFNIMTPKTVFKIHRVEGKLHFRQQVFHVPWRCKDDQISHKLHLTIDQGFCSIVYNSEKIDGIDLDDERTANANFLVNYKMTPEQINLTKDVIVVISCPITFSETTAAGVKRSVLGVFNVESHDKASKVVLSDLAARQSFFITISAIASIYAAAD